MNAAAVQMEWIKFRSLRSSRWALLATAVGMIAIGVVTMAATTAPDGPEAAATFDPTNNVLAGVALGQLIVGVLGVLTMTGEYSSGSIRATLAAVPDRRRVLAAKAMVLGVVTLAVGQTAAFATYFAGRAALSDSMTAPALGDPGVLRAVVLSGVYLTLVGLVGLALGAIIRHPASAIGALVGLYYVVPAVLAGLTGTTIAKFFPTIIAGNSIAVAKPVADVLSPWVGFATLLLYTAAALAVADWLLRRRDA